jgi:hypothetical protein
MMNRLLAPPHLQSFLGFRWGTGHC